jgi:hypothetical protein
MHHSKSGDEPVVLLFHCCTVVGSISHNADLQPFQDISTFASIYGGSARTIYLKTTAHDRVA